MSASSITAFNPNDATQTSFLAALALGENPQGNPSLGVGGANLAGSSTDQYGFPTWGGISTQAGPSHAAGLFQFEPGTWDSLAKTFGLNFGSTADQEQGAWILAQQTYQQQTGGNLETDLQAGKYGQVQAALASVWPSVTGNGSAPQGLAHDLGSGLGVDLSSVGGGSVSRTGSAAGGSTSGPSGWIATIENFFVRFGLIAIGGVIVVVALWQLLSNVTSLPSPGETARAAGTAVALA